MSCLSINSFSLIYGRLLNTINEVGYGESRGMKLEFEINTAHSVRKAITIGVSVVITIIVSLTNNPAMIVGTALIVRATASTAIREPKRAKQNQ